jgi:hypothetical protein
VKKYKILVEREGKLYSPFQRSCYGKTEEVIGKEFVCENFDDSIFNDCSTGFYATDLEGLIYTSLKRKGSVIVECEMDGKNIRFDQFKHRFEKQTIKRIVPESEIKELLTSENEKLGYNIKEALFPINPLTGEAKKVTEKEIELLKKWGSVGASVGGSVGASVGGSVWGSVGASVRASVRASVWASVWASVRDSVWGSVWDSVWASVWASVRDSVGASVWDSVWASVRDSVRGYTSSFFPNITKWNYIDHEAGVNPFQSCIDLWKSGFVPSFDGKKWRLHSGSKAEVVYELTP